MPPESTDVSTRPGASGPAKRERTAFRAEEIGVATKTLDRREGDRVDVTGSAGVVTDMSVGVVTSYMVLLLVSGR